MDKHTLDSLKHAFAQAPSAELAKVIVFNGLDQDFSDIQDYVEQLSRALEADERSKLIHYLIGQNQAQVARSFLAEEPSLERCLVEAELGNLELAKDLYLQLISQQAELANPELAERLGIGAAPKERPKLRVVEKAEAEPVADLNLYRQKTTNFSDVVGLTKIKKQIHKKIILPFQKPSLFQRFRKKVGGGVLLYGPPGCGKTLLARATAGECNASFYNIEISDVLDMYIGESENKLHAIFERARADTPCVLFFDELEALAGKREHSRGNGANIVSQFLTELDGFNQNNHGVLVLASTNVPWSIDSAFLRPGRFDRLFFVPPPDKEARSHILDYYLKDRPTESKIDTAAIAAKTPGFSGADLENLIDAAADEAIDETLDAGREVDISYQHLKTALTDSRATTTEWLTTARNYARYANEGGRYDDVLEFLNKNGR